MVGVDAATTAAHTQITRRSMTGPNHVATLRFVALAALIFGLWTLQHPYPGIFHDAQLYTMQALARVFPADLASDVFLRYGSQDHFTFFGPLYAAAIRALDVGPAAAALTFTFHAAFAAALVLLARRILPAHLVWLGVGLVCVVPFTYGARKVFFVMEDFVTPRLLAEAFVLLALAAALDRRFKLAIVAILAAGLMHPIMALTGLGMGVFLDVFTKKQRTVMLATAGAGLLAAFALLALRGSPVRFDDDWWSLIHSGLPYLFPLEWRKLDWARVIVTATILYAAVQWVSAGRVREVSRAALIALALGLALSIIGADVLRLVLVTQLQAWRVAWLAGAIALLVSPMVVIALWRGGLLARIALAALLAAFLMADERFALSSAMLAAVLVLATPWVKQEPPALRIVLWGMCAVLALAAVINVASSAIVARAVTDQDAVPQWLRGIRAVSGTGLIPALVLVALGWAIVRMPPKALALASVGCCAFAVVIACAAFPQWSRSPYSAASVAAFADWRARIPQGTEVLWYAKPLASWALLRRPNYASMQQSASALFSREAAMVLRDRLLALKPIADSLDPPAGPKFEGDELRKPALSEICNAAAARFVVSRDALESEPIATIADSPSPELRDWKLYSCAARTGPGQ